MKQLYAPTGAKIVAVLETTPCTVGVNGFEDDGSPIYDGNGSDMDWDNQEMVAASDGTRTVIDENDTHWAFGACELRDAADENGEGEKPLSRVSMSTAAFGVRIGDRIIQRPTWPDGREVVDFDLDDTRITFTYAGEDECKETFGAADPVIVSRIV